MQKVSPFSIYRVIFGVFRVFGVILGLFDKYVINHDITTFSALRSKYVFDSVLIAFYVILLAL